MPIDSQQKQDLLKETLAGITADFAAFGNGQKKLTTETQAAGNPAPIEQESKESTYFENIKEDIGRYELTKHSTAINDRTKKIELESLLDKVDKGLLQYIKNSQSKDELKEVFAYIKGVDDEALQIIKENNEVRKSVWDNMRRINEERKMREQFEGKVEGQYSTAGQTQGEATTDFAQSSNNPAVAAETVAPVMLETTEQTEEGNPPFDSAKAEENFANGGGFAAEVGESVGSPQEVATTAETQEAGPEVVRPEVMANDSDHRAVQAEMSANPVATESIQAESVSADSDSANQAQEEITQPVTAEAKPSEEATASHPVIKAAYDNGELVDRQESSQNVTEPEEQGLIKTSNGDELIKKAKENIRNLSNQGPAPRPDFFSRKSHLEEPLQPQNLQAPALEQATSGDDGLIGSERDQLAAAEKEGEGILSVRAEEAPAEEASQLVGQHVEENQPAQVDASPAAVEFQAAQAPEAETKPAEVLDISDKIRERDKQGPAEQTSENLAASQPPAEVLDISKQIGERDQKRPGGLRGWWNRVTGREALTTDMFSGPERVSVLRSEEGDKAAQAAQQERVEKAA